MNTNNLLFDYINVLLKTVVTTISTKNCLNNQCSLNLVQICSVVTTMSTKDRLTTTCTQKLLHTVTIMSTKDCLTTTNTLLYTKATVETTDQRHHCDKVENVEIPFLHFSSLTILEKLQSKATNTKIPKRTPRNNTNLELFLKSYYYVVFGVFWVFIFIAFRLELLLNCEIKE